MDQYCKYADLVADYAELVAPQEHRPKDQEASCMGMVTRAIKPSDPEFRNPYSKAAIMKEIQRLRDANVWEEANPIEWKVACDKYGGKDGPGLMCGRLHVILGVKNAEADLPEAQREYKARVVFGGHRISTSDGAPAHEMFQALSSGPNSMTTARLAMSLAALHDGYTVTVRDAEQAYIQSRIDTAGRPRTYVRLPFDMWPPSWVGRYRDPVCLLHRALYGHPESGALWEQHLAARLTKLGWQRIHAAQGLWFQPQERAALTTYVDDLVLVCAKHRTRALWKQMEDEVKFKEPESQIERYLGTYHELTHSPSGSTTLKVFMKDFFSSAVTRFEKELGSLVKVEGTPHLTEETGEVLDAPDPTSRFHHSAPSHLMKVLYGARMSRPDLTFCVSRLASSVTRWSKHHDRALVKMFGYIKGTLEIALVGCLSPKDKGAVYISVYSDADLNGERESSKSFSGFYAELVGLEGRRWPLSWSSKRQVLSATSSAESELIALAIACRKEGLPSQEIFSVLLQRKVRVVFHEDNQAVIAAIKNGYSANLRHLSRTLRVCLGSLHETFHGACKDSPFGSAEVRYVATKDQCADICTKRLAAPQLSAARKLIGMSMQEDKEKNKVEKNRGVAKKSTKDDAAVVVVSASASGSEGSTKARLRNKRLTPVREVDLDGVHSLSKIFF